jgi:uroporphyrinogen decarboxylase
VNARQRFHETMHFGSPDRVPYWEMGFWGQTIDRWEDEGMPPDIHHVHLFGFDRREMVPINHGIIPGFREQTIEDTERYVIKRHGDGVLSKRMKEGEARGTPPSMDQRYEFPVRDRASWNDFKRRLNPKSPCRYPAFWEDYKRCVRDRDYPLGIHGGSLFGYPRNWMGFETASIMMYDDPGLMHEIMDYLADFMIQLITPALAEIGDIDYGIFWEDMCYKTASIISPKHFKEFMVPHYQRITAVMRKHGVDVIMVDSDGHVDELVPLWLEGGVNGVYPFEVAAGEDVVALRKQYPRDLLMFGGIDKRALAKDRRAIEEEVYSKVPWLVEQGGYIPGIDHAVPHDVPYANYRYYRDLLRRVCEKG